MFSPFRRIAFLFTLSLFVINTKVLLDVLAKKIFYIILEICGSNSMARVPAFQAGCCEFESRLPLHKDQ